MSVPSGPAGGLQPVLEHLGMHQAANVLAGWLDRAAAQELSYADFLQGLLEEESAARANAATQKRLRQAGFPYAATKQPPCSTGLVHAPRAGRERVTLGGRSDSVLAVKWAGR